MAPQSLIYAVAAYALGLCAVVLVGIAVWLLVWAVAYAKVPPRD